MRKLTLAEIEYGNLLAAQGNPRLPAVAVLENIRSLHNVGSIFRSADAFGIHKIYLCGITGTPPHREIQKTALGASETVPWEYFSEPLDCIAELKKNQYQIIAVEQTTQSIEIIDTSFQHQPVAFVFGNEVTGVSEVVIQHCDAATSIKQYGNKHSLNVAVAAGIVFFVYTQKTIAPKS